jgi:hypothetical protein
MPAYLEVWRPSGPELVALTGQRVTLGKDPSNTVVVDHDRTVSRLYAVLEDCGGTATSSRPTSSSTPKARPTWPISV